MCWATPLRAPVYRHMTASQFTALGWPRSDDRQMTVYARLSSVRAGLSFLSSSVSSMRWLINLEVLIFIKIKSQVSKYIGG